MLANFGPRAAVAGGPTKGKSSSRSAAQPKTFRGRTRPNLPLSSKYKTEMCHYLAEQGQCPFEDQCTYAHTRSELRHIERHPKHKTLPCRDFSTVGFCPFGERCSFVHYKRDPDDILKTTYLLNQPSKKSCNSTQSWGSSSVALTVSPAPGSEETRDSDHGSFAGFVSLPPPWNEMEINCGEAFPAAIVQDPFLRVPGVLPRSLNGVGYASMSSSPHSNSSSGYSGTPLSPLGSPSCPSSGSLSRASSSSDLSDIGASIWPAQLQFGSDTIIPGVAQVWPSPTYEDSKTCKNGQRLPVFRNISSRPE